MTLEDFIRYIGDEPKWLLLYFLAIPLTALLAGMLGKGEGHMTPWRNLYAVLIYAVCIPGIFSVALLVYDFLFAGRNLYQASIIAQIVPVLSMLLTVYIIRRQVDFEYIPGFDKLTGLITMLTAILLLMWLAQRVHLVVWTNLPFWQLILIFIGLVFLVRMAWRRFVGW